RRAMDAEYAQLTTICRRLKRKLKLRTPKSDPSIVFGSDNDADGLKYYSDQRPPHTLNGYIYPEAIEAELERHMPCTDDEDRRRTKALALSPDQVALQQRLTARLVLSRAYQRQIVRVSNEIGLSAFERKTERLLRERARHDNRILALPAWT